ncbi:MAG: response regulator transcription factor [Bacteroidota bacterium]
MKNKILIAEDNENFGLMLYSYLRMNHYEVTWAKNGLQALEETNKNVFDLFIFDVMMPLKDGFELAIEIRKKGHLQPLLFLTAKGIKEDKIKGYTIGAVDYLVKPFDPEILLLKIGALLTQFNTGKEAKQDIFHFGSFELDVNKRTLSLYNKHKKISPKETELLQLFVTNENKVVTREYSLLKIWQNDGYFPTQSMNVFITKLRNYLNEDPNFDCNIESIRGKGFMFTVNKKK